MYCLELGGEDDAFAAREAESAATGVEVVAPGLATARGIRPARVRSLAYTHRASDFVGRTDASVESARTLLDAADVDREGTVAVRARDVHGATGISTQAVERTLGSVLVDRGFAVDLDDPDHELRALFSRPESPDSVPESDAPDADTDDVDTAETDASDDDSPVRAVCLLGWLTVESVRDFGTRRPTDRPFFQPGSMAPLDARAFVNIAGAEPDATILDPMCGTGGVLIEAGLVGARTVGVDAQWKMVRGARENLAAYVDGDADVVRGDATALPLGDETVDGVVFDAPYGRQSKIARHDLRDLVAGALTEAARVSARAVVVADRSWVDAAESAGWTVERVFERRVHRSLTRYVHVLYRERGEERSSCSQPTSLPR